MRKPKDLCHHSTLAGVRPFETITIRLFSIAKWETSAFRVTTALIETAQWRGKGGEGKNSEPQNGQHTGIGNLWRPSIMNGTFKHLSGGGHLTCSSIVVTLVEIRYLWISR